MKGTRAASRYAKSLLDLSTEQKTVEEVYKDMEMIASTVSKNREFAVVLQSPIIKSDKKQSILDSLFPKATDLTKGFINIIVRKGRENILGQIAEAFVQQYKTQKGIIVAELKSAVKLDDKLKAKILDLVNPSKKQVEVLETIDASIIGGFIVRVDDKQVDASIATRITELKLAFSKNAYISDL